MLPFEMRRISLNILKDSNPPGQLYQVPAAGATYQVFRQGATVVSPATLVSSSTIRVEVYHTGLIKRFEAIHGSGDPSVLLTVADIDPNRKWLDVFAIDDSTMLSPGDRLMPVDLPPTLYLDSVGNVPLPSNTITLDANGRASFFCRATSYDAVLSGAGPIRAFPDSEGGWVRGGLSWVNARDYPNIQEAVNECPPGGTVFIPAGDYRVPSGGLVINRALTLMGETGTKLLSYSVANDQPVIRIVPGGHNLNDVELRNLILTCDSKPGTRLTNHCGILCDVPTDGSKVGSLLLDRVRVFVMGDDGIRLTAYGDNDSFFVFVTMRQVTATECRGHGFFIQTATMVSLTDCYFNSNDGCGVRADAAEITFRCTAFENNCLGPWVSPTFDGQVRVRGCYFSRFDACHWEHFVSDAVPPPKNYSNHYSKRGLVIENSPGCTVANSLFSNPKLVPVDPDAQNPVFTDPQDAASRGIFCTYGAGPGVQGSLFHGNVFLNVATALEIDGTTHPALDCLVLPHNATAGSGAVMLPYGVSADGLQALSRRAVPTGQFVGQPKVLVVTPGQLHGTLIPAMATTDFQNLETPQEGHVMYDTGAKVVKIFRNNAWEVL